MILLLVSDDPIIQEGIESLIYRISRNSRPHNTDINHIESMPTVLHCTHQDAVINKDLIIEKATSVLFHIDSIKKIPTSFIDAKSRNKNLNIIAYLPHSTPQAHRQLDHNYIDVILTSDMGISDVEKLMRKALGADYKSSQTNSTIAANQYIYLLPPKKKRIIELVSQGKTNKQIAREMNLSEGTIKNYLSDAYHRLNVANRAEAATLFRSKIY